MKNFFLKLLKKGEGFFKQSISIEQPLWFYLAVIVGAYVAGYLVGKL